jgi:hypothetical protein
MLAVLWLAVCRIYMELHELAVNHSRAVLRDYRAQQGHV